MSRPMEVTADLLQDFLTGKLNDEERRRVERAIKDDRRIAAMLEIMRARTEIMRASLELESEIPADWLAILGRWEPRR